LEAKACAGGVMALGYAQPMALGYAQPMGLRRDGTIFEAFSAGNAFLYSRLTTQHLINIGQSQTSFPTTLPSNICDVLSMSQLVCCVPVQKPER